ncbi:MAG: lipopolysaccharide heptosyltransferase II [Thermodesulfovibrionales bacterium]|nr:lipopolysaccharide heptosyltransferase II [Thermodesulfovibrionales bacterium]MDP3112580.1 lipopolysaccharide heptosyltransferase II [Thermodesulfovibrionales bacterium]
MSDKTIKFSKAPGKILVIKPSSLGDIVHSLPFLNAIRDRFPKSEIHWVVARGLEGLLEGHPMISKLWIINKDNWKKIKNIKGTVSELKDLFKSLKKEKFDIVVDLQGLLRSGILAAATGASVRIGFSEAREGSGIFYTHRVKGGKDIHAVDRYLKIAKFLGSDVADIKFPFPLSFSSQLSALGFQFQDEYAVFVPGARWRTKRWPSERFGELASILSVKTLVVGGKSDIDISNRVATGSKGNAMSVAGMTSIKELIDIMRKAKFVVSNDSGPMHIAAALGVPVFAIFGPTNPLRTGPYGKGHVVIRKGFECSPCYKKGCKDVRCMDAVSVKEVAETICQGTLKGLPKKGY